MMGFCVVVFFGLSATVAIKRTCPFGATGAGWVNDNY